MTEITLVCFALAEPRSFGPPRTAEGGCPYIVSN